MPARRDNKRPRFVVSRPPKPPNQMTDKERREWAEQIAAGLKPETEE